MQTLSQANKQNAEMMELHKRDIHKTGIACDKCSNELTDQTQTINASNPPSKWLWCETCKEQFLYRLW